MIRLISWNLALLFVCLWLVYSIVNAEEKTTSKMLANLHPIQALTSSDDNDLVESLQQINNYIDAIQKQNFEKLTEGPQFSEVGHEYPGSNVGSKSGEGVQGILVFDNRKLVYVNFYRYVIGNLLKGEKSSLNRGFRLYFDPDGKPTLYVEGFFMEVSDTILQDDSIYRTGVCIAFHTNGLPSKYRKIIDEREVFSLEWDKEGNILSIPALVQPF